MPKVKYDGTRLTELIAPAFYPVYWDVRDGLHTYYDLFGGRGSTKSSFISVELVTGVMEDPLANAVVFRKVANTIGTSVYEQVLWAINELGVQDLWKGCTNPYRFTYKPTGQVILFRGLDKAKKMKSIKVSKGYLKYLWFEELDEFAGEEEIRSVQQSVMRGGPKFVVFKSFNPPISKSNWANEYVLKPKRRSLRHKSCYLDVPREWLGEQFFDDAEDLKETNPRAYEHEYIGNAVGTGGEVFDNLEIRIITAAERSRFDNIYMGIDWGWYPDPFHWGKMHYDAARRTLYIFDEFRTNKMSNYDTWNSLRLLKGVTGMDLITADSAEEKSIGDYRDYGSLCRPAIKGPGSVKYGMKWLQSLRKIVIDPISCPHTAKEFNNYEYERTPDDEIMSSYPDKDNHSIDMTRYAMERVYKRKGQ
ncbi:MAG: PBSX family phage terminase large subunit [Lachnospiraceae bacterium]|nr:PBSX family phage terminase large subunit [Lachnospiraceae bacterium]